MDDHDIQIREEDLPDFTLEDILKEFSAPDDDGRLHDAAAPELLEDLPQLERLEDAPLSEQPPRLEEPEILIWTPSPKQAAPARSFSDTVRVDTEKVRKNLKKSTVTDDTRAFTPLGQQPQEMPAPTPASPIPEGAEPFSANWEPQYDQPIDDYVPSEPIVFRPRSRLSELKQKLLEGPERQYNALCEKGVGKLRIALFAGMLIVFAAIFTIVLHRMNMVQENRMRLLVFGELFAMLISACLCWERMLDGIGGLFRGRFSTDTLLAFSFAACIADGFYCLKEVTVPFCAAFCLNAVMCLWAEYQRRCTRLRQMDTLRKAIRLNRLTKVPGCVGDDPGFFLADGQPEDFMDCYNTPAAPEKAVNTFALLGLGLSLAVAAAAGIHGGLRVGVRTWSAAILAVCPATMLISQTRPAWTLQRRLHRFGAVLCGWAGVKAATGRVVVRLRDEELLPPGSVKINGHKFYSKTHHPDTIIAYTTAVLSESGCSLAPLFEHIHKTRRSQSYELEEFKNYDGKGYGAIICGQQVLVGSLDFLRSMDIQTPAGIRADHPVCIAIAGEFSACFPLVFAKLKGVGAGLSALCGQRKLTRVMTGSNFILDETFLRKKFRIDTRRIAFPDLPERERLAAWKPEGEHSAPISLTTQEGLAGPALAIAGARALHTASIAGAAVHILGGLVGLSAVLILTLAGRTDLMTPANLLLLELIWAVPGLMVSEWTRNL